MTNLKRFSAAALTVACCLIAAGTATAQSGPIAATPVDEGVLGAALRYAVAKAPAGLIAVDPRVTGLSGKTDERQYSNGFRDRVVQALPNRVAFHPREAVAGDCRANAAECRVTSDVAAFIKLGMPTVLGDKASLLVTTFHDREFGGHHMRTVVLHLEVRSGTWVVVRETLFAET